MGDKYPRFKAAAVQDSTVFLDQKASVEKACKLMMEASKDGAKLVAFPETFVPGYPYWIWMDAPSANHHFFLKLFEEAVEIPSAATEELCQAAKEADIYAVVGINEKLPTQMGTMWSTNLLIDNRGRILGKHRKIVPTFAEKMIWSSGDGNGLRVWETELGRIGTLACGNNVHNLYKYALISQGEQIHVANFPALDGRSQSDLPRNRIMSLAYSLEGKLFTISSSGTIDSYMVDVLCEDDSKKRNWLRSLCSYSCIIDPLGNTMADAEDKDCIIYADIDISEEIVPKQYHDIIGTYTRMDVVSLNLCQEEDRPVWNKSRVDRQYAMQKKGVEEVFTDLLRQSNRDIIQRLERLEELLRQGMGAVKKSNES